MTASRSGKSQAAFRTISEVADELDVAQHVLRFWESKFPQVRPLKRGGGRRYYRPEDIELLRDIRALLYDEGYTIKGAQKLLRQRRARPPAGPPAKPSPTAAPADEPPADHVPTKHGPASHVAANHGPDAEPPAKAVNEPPQHQLGAVTAAPPASSETTSGSRTDAGPDDASLETSLPPASGLASASTSADEDLERLRQVRDALAALRHELATLLAAEGG